MWRQIIPAFRITLVFTLLTGLIYPPLVTGLCQLFFPYQANGSLIRVHGRVVGSALIGQRFTQPGYFHPRPSAAGNGYDAAASGGSNLGPTSRNLVLRVKAAVARFRNHNPDDHGAIPADLLTASGSGLDPDISLASAYAEAPRVAKARGIALARLRQFIHAHAALPWGGFLGEPRVNVLLLNLALDAAYPVKVSR